ncbi:hypothetical protein OUZ56_027424 [Daphnia magna]|uniref:Uncharacterized protein n=1 Tax=Daphnia magna TaxID=35525 RepID=A0ABQ9ZPS1_9CRUS|nr:hypothetical protein OUZ56_027424 [Daphnia magna]
MKIDYQVNFGEAKISLEAVCLLSNGFGTGSLAVAALSRKREKNTEQQKCWSLLNSAAFLFVVSPQQYLPPTVGLILKKEKSVSDERSSTTDRHIQSCALV